MEKIVYCVFRRTKNTTDTENDELIGVYDNEPSARSIMDIMEVLYMDEETNIFEIQKDGFKHNHVYCVECPLNRVRRTELCYIQALMRKTAYDLAVKTNQIVKGQ